MYAFSKCFSMHFAVMYVCCLVTVCLFCSSLVTINSEVGKAHALQAPHSNMAQTGGFSQSSSLDVSSKISLPKGKPELCILH